MSIAQHTVPACAPGRLLRRFLAERGGLAAVEFALLMPTLFALLFGTYELFFRVRAVDSFQRYVFQTGDLLSREDALTSADIDRVFDYAGSMMPDIIVADGLVLQVTSIGFDEDDEPVPLWVRHRGPQTLPLEVEDAQDLGEFTQTIMKVTAKFTYETPFQILFSDGSLTTQRTVYFRPRLTRAIAIDGEVAEMNQGWDQAS